MIRKTTIELLLFSLCMLGSAGAAAQVPLDCSKFLAANQFGELFSVDPKDGTSLFVGAVPGTTEIEFDNVTGTLFGDSTNGRVEFYDIDPTTGAVNGYVTHPYGALNGMEYVDSVLYATFIDDPTGPSRLVIVDVNSGDLDFVGFTGFGPISGLAYDKVNGTMWGVTGSDIVARLVTINLETGAATLMSYLVDDQGQRLQKVGSIEFGVDGELYGGLTSRAPILASHLVRIDTATGIAAVVGDTGFSISGLTSCSDEFPMFIRAPGDINGDGSQDIVALIKDANALTATVKDAEDGHLINTVIFDANLVPVDLEVMADINANGAPELVILGTGSTRAEVRDALTGEHLGAVAFYPALSAIDLELATDQTSNSIPELAMLGQGSVQVEVKDPLTQGTVNTLSFNANHLPKDLSVWGIDSITAVAVLGASKDPTRGDKVEIRDLDTGDVIRHLWLGKGWEPLQMEVIADVNDNGAPEAAVLREHPNDGLVSVLLMDTASGARLTHLGFDPNYNPLRLRVVPDVNDNGSDEVAVLATRRACCNQKVWVKDSKTRETISQVSFDKTYVGADLDVSPDINGNGTPELVMLGRRDDGKRRAIIKDAKTGELIATVKF